jgi:prepilin-type N-terminal cleavage/methylation domain-containing protein
MKNIKKQWFTLVELIVVITILAILWSIAFISLQGYSADARNSKRTSDLNSLISGITTSLAQWQSVYNFVSSVATSEVTSISLAWTWVVSGDYAAGPINYNALPIKASDFKDPSSGDSYVMWATTKINGKYELSTSMEQWAGERVAKLVWNYNPRAATAISATAASWSTTVTLVDTTKVNFFSLWDTVTDSSWKITTISRVSSDGTTITLAAATNTGTTTLALSNGEEAGLIDAVGATIWIIVDQGATNLPY